MAEGMHVVEAGSGRTIVLVHGTMDRAGGLARVARHLRHRHVVRYDRRGYAGSAALGPGTLDAHVADLVALLGDLSADGGDRPVLVGHSYGGLVALLAAGAAPDAVGAVGAYEPPTPWHPSWPAGIETWRGDPADAVDRVVEHAVGRERWARAPSALRAARRREGEAMLTEMRSLRGPDGGPPAGLRPLAVPVSLAHGSASAPHVVDGLADLADRLGVASLVRLDGPGHRAPVTHASALAAWIDDLVARSDALAAGAPAS